MLKARKGNRVLRIPDEKKPAYIALGYTITDLEGNIIHEHVEPTEKLAELEKENEDLKAANKPATDESKTKKVAKAPSDTQK